MGDFESDEIYDLEDEGGLSMRQAQRESRRRIEALCKGRKLADSVELVSDDLLRELQMFLTRCAHGAFEYHLLSSKQYVSILKLL